MGKIITIDSKEADKVIVFLNNYPLRYWVAAEEGDNGWVEVVDTSSLQEIANESEPSAEPEDEPEPMKALPTKRIEGKVTFKTK